MTCFTVWHLLLPQTSISHCAACCSWRECVFPRSNMEKLKVGYRPGSSCFSVAVEISPCSRGTFFHRSMLRSHFVVTSIAAISFLETSTSMQTSALFLQQSWRCASSKQCVAKVYLSKFNELLLTFLLVHLYNWLYRGWEEIIVIGTLRMKNKVTTTYSWF